MEQIPDDPRIREAELFGTPPYDDDPEPICPVCGKECETIYTQSGEPVGCDECLTLWEASEWCYEHREEQQ